MIHAKHMSALHATPEQHSKPWWSLLFEGSKPKHIIAEGWQSQLNRSMAEEELTAVDNIVRNCACCRKTKEGPEVGRVGEQGDLVAPQGYVAEPLNHKGLLCDWHAVHSMQRSGEVTIPDLLPTVTIEVEDQALHQSLCDALESELSRLVVPLNSQRSNAKDQLEGTVRSLTLGAYCVRGAGVTRLSEKHAKVLELVHRLAAQCPQVGPYLAVTVNQLSSLLPHRDKNNQHYNFIMLLGDFSYGELWLGDDKVQVDDVSFAELKRQSGVRVRRKRQWVAFDPQRLHAVLPAKGTRWSVVLYTPKHVQHLSALDWQHLAHLGFPVQHAWERFGCHALDGGGALAKVFTQKCGELTDGQGGTNENTLADQYWQAVAKSPK
eukprot:6453156-Amphidinium_carterae.1